MISFPSGLRATISVNVPPRSIQNCQRALGDIKGIIVEVVLIINRMFDVLAGFSECDVFVFNMTKKVCFLIEIRIK